MTLTFVQKIFYVTLKKLPPLCELGKKHYPIKRPICKTLTIYTVFQQILN